MILRDYQEEIKGRVYAAWEAGCRSVMCQMPTGTGKTVVLAQVIKEQTLSVSQADISPVKRGRTNSLSRVLVVAHRKEILEQIRETLAKYGLGDRLEDGSIVVESIQKLSKGLMTEGKTLALGANAQDMTDEEASGTVADDSTGELSSTGAAPSLVIIDEAHHCTAKTYRMLWEALPEARFLGMTATPCRLKQEGFEDLFDRLICSYSVKQFIDKGWLADYDYVVIRPDGEMKRRIDSLKKRGVDGDYQQKELGTVMDNRACIEQLFESYRKYAEGRQGIIYAINQEHARHIAEYYTLALGANAQDLPDGEPSGTGADDSTAQLLSTVADDDSAAKLLSAVADDDSAAQLPSTKAVAVVDSATPKKERERINKEYREGKIRILVNCDIYSEGVDMPDCSFIQLARPTLSLSKYIQQVGRGLRPNKDGSHTLILDNVGMYHLFGLPDAERDWQKMFHKGQVVNAYETVKYGFVHDSRNADQQVLGGHNLDMYVVDSTSREGKVEIVWTTYMGMDYCTFARNGEIIDERHLFERTDGFVDGFCWMQNGPMSFHKYFYDDCGKYIVSFPGDSELKPNGFVCVNKKGFASYYDLKTRIRTTCLPNVYEYGGVEFVKFDGGLHLRNSEYVSIEFMKSNIKVMAGYVLAIDKSKNESYVIKDEGRIVYRVLGKEDVATTILWDASNAKTLHKLQCGMITAISKDDEPELYEKWKGAKDQLSKIMPLVRKKTYVTEGDTPSLLEKGGLYGWYVGNKIRCKAKFKDILDASMYNFFILVINKKDRRILVNNEGYTIYDRYEIDKIDEEKVLLLPVNEIQESLKHHVDKVYIDIADLISMSQEDISEIIEYKDIRLRVKHEDKGLIHITPDDEELGHIHLSDLEDKRYYLMFTDSSDQNGRKIIYAKQKYYYVTEMHSEKYMYLEDVKTHKAYILSYSNTSYTLEIRERNETGGWNVQNMNDSSQGTANESIRKFLQRYSKVK